MPKHRPAQPIHPDDIELPTTPANEFYVVIVGQEPGIFYNWNDAASRVLGVSKNIHFKCATFQEALQRYKDAYYGNEVKCVPNPGTRFLSQSMLNTSSSSRSPPFEESASDVEYWKEVEIPQVFHANSIPSARIGPNSGKFVIVLEAAQIECCIDEWSTGTRTDIPFTIQEYRATYDSHLKCLQAFAEATKTYDVLPSICRRLYEVGRIHSGAAPLTAPTEVTVSAQIIATAIKEHEEGSTTEDESD
ncbi:hypothetical protein EDD15DRAFT_2410951 [Pisolithus albus]|nr:hypothetical protein EDD15DRAFT_2410951 [Pisolithus albus]